MSARIEPELAVRLRGDPGTRLEVILTATDGLDELVAQLPTDVQVEHRYRLIAGVAVTATAGTLRRVAEMSVVKSMEPVRPVRSC